MMQQSPIGVLLHEVNSLRILWANKRACELFKYSVEELRSLKAHHMSSQDERYRREDGVAWLHSAAIFGSSHRQWKYLASDGTEFLTVAIATFVKLHDKDVIMVEMRPIDDAITHEESVDWAATSLERIISHTTSGILVFDHDNHVTRASPYAAGLFGKSSESIIGISLLELGLISPDTAKEELLKNLVQTDAKVNFRIQVKNADSTFRWLAAYLENIKIEHSTFRVLMVRDITDRVEAEQRVAAQQTQLQYLSRYNAMGDMALILAHDLGQPLSASLNFLSGLKARLNSPSVDAATLSYGIEMIEKQLNRASDIVTSAKRYVRRIESTTATFNLLDAVEESLYFVRLRAEELGVEIKVDLGNRPLVLEGEPVLIGQIIINLCMNAIDEIKRPETTIKTLEVTLREFGGLASLSVSDHGRGMQTIPADRLASGAFSAKEDGSGIGLLISEQIAQRHGGTIQFSPNEPQGTIATLSLPLKPIKS
ncbi:PAS domain-containing sensor histidine kinase [Corynebacterium crudilactis]|uniref:histidine kinase n=2 Tax=Corynebacterium crudilactis TaxID=1652495 RepID=A0A172QXI6_9CORY|nr:PAS domain-containing sensor histidine kinase [Corynebacterium crudilactis]